MAPTVDSVPWVLGLFFFGPAASKVPLPAVSISLKPNMDGEVGGSFQSDYEGSIDTYIGTEEVPKDEVQIS